MLRILTLALLAACFNLSGCSTVVVAHARAFHPQPVSVSLVSIDDDAPDGMKACFRVVGQSDGARRRATYLLVATPVAPGVKRLSPAAGVPPTPCHNLTPRSALIESGTDYDIPFAVGPEELAHGCPPGDLAATLRRISEREPAGRDTRRYRVKVCGHAQPGLLVGVGNGRIERQLYVFDESTPWAYEHGGNPWLYPLLLVTVPLDAYASWILLVLGLAP